MKFSVKFLPWENSMKIGIFDVQFLFVPRCDINTSRHHLAA